eukprot:107404_1
MVTPHLQINAKDLLGKQIIQTNKITQIKLKTPFMDIYCGDEHTLALDCNGQIWSWGYGGNGRLGHGDEDNRYKPTQIKYFMNNNINIRQICCGNSHNLVLSNTHKIYLFGRNDNNNVLTPQLNEKLENKNIIDIKCGRNHNMARTHEQKYWFWGHDNYNQCLRSSECEYEYAKKPSLFVSKNFINETQEIIDI